MVQNGVWSVLVERGGLPVGVITDGDIMRRCFAKRLDPEACKAQDIMSSPVLTVGPDEPIMEAMKLMAAHDVRRLFVAESGKIVGRVTQTGLFMHMLNMTLALQVLGLAI